MSRVARHLALRFCGHLALLAAAAATAALAVPAAAWSVLPSPWPFAAPLAVAAAGFGAVRLRQRGEDVALAAAGTPRWAIAVLPALATAVLQLAVAWPGARDAGRLSAGTALRPVVAVDGSLLLAGAQRGFVWRADAARPEPVAGTVAGFVALPPGFVPEPGDPGRLRRQLFVVGTPRHPTAHPDDPTLLRWLWLGAGSVGVLLALGAGVPAVRRLAWLPLALCAAALLG